MLDKWPIYVLNCPNDLCEVIYSIRRFPFLYCQYTLQTAAIFHPILINVVLIAVTFADVSALLENCFSVRKIKMIIPE